MKKLFLLLFLMGVFFSTQAQIDPTGDGCEEFEEFLEANYPCLQELGMPIDCSFLNFIDIDVNDLSDEEIAELLFNGNDPCGNDEPIGGGDGDPSANDSLELEMIFAELSAEFPDCLSDFTADAFANVDELFIYVFESGDCFEDFPEPTLEDEFIFLQSCFPNCLADYTVDDFADVEALYDLVYNSEGCAEEVEGYNEWDETEFIIEELAWMQEMYPGCLSDYTADDFETIDELFELVFGEGGCEENSWIDDSTWLEPTLEDEFVFLQSCFPNCLADYTVADFTDIEALYDFVYNSEGCAEEVEGYELTEAEILADELLWMQEMYPGCLADYTADDFETIDELFELVFGQGGCEENSWIDDSTWTEFGIAEELEFLQSVTDGCLDNSTADDFADLDELYAFFEDNCSEDGPDGPWGEPTLEEVFDGFIADFPDCFDGLTAADFTSVEELFMYVLTSECEGGTWTDTTDTDINGEEGEWEMPDDLGDWMDDSYPAGPAVDFIFGEDDEVIGVSVSNGVSITFDENSVIITLDGLTVDNLPADIETYLTDNGYMDGVTDVTVTEDEDGNIIIVVTVEVDGGKSSDIVTLSFDLDGKLLSSDAVVAGINTITDLSIKGYPNPTTDQLFVTAGSTIENIVVINQIGQVVYTANPIATQTRISLETLPTGMYILKVTTEEGVKGMSILKK